MVAVPPEPSGRIGVGREVEAAGVVPDLGVGVHDEPAQGVAEPGACGMDASCVLRLLGEHRDRDHQVAPAVGRFPVEHQAVRGLVELVAHEASPLSVLSPLQGAKARPTDGIRWTAAALPARYRAGAAIGWSVSASGAGAPEGSAGPQRRNP